MSVFLILGQKKCPKAQKEESPQKRRKQDTWTALCLEFMGMEFHTQSLQGTHREWGKR